MNKLVLGLILIPASIIAVMGFALKRQSDSSTRLYSNLVGKEQDYQQLSDYVAKLKVDYQSQDQLRDETEQKFKDQIESLQGRIKVLSESDFQLSGVTLKEPKGPLVTDSFVSEEVYLKDGPPVGYVKLFKDGSVESGLYDSKVEVSSAVSQDEATGKYSILNKADFTLLADPVLNRSEHWKGEAFPLTISSGAAQVDPTQPIVQIKRMYWWNPKADVNLTSDFTEIDPGAGVSLMSYGLTKNDSDFKFLELGFQDYDSKLEPTLLPVMWRPFSGLTSNTYLGAGASFVNRGFRYVLSVTVGL